jgi:hypothetical protein
VNSGFCLEQLRCTDEASAFGGGRQRQNKVVDLWQQIPHALHELDAGHGAGTVLAHLGQNAHVERQSPSSNRKRSTNPILT